MSQRRRDRNFPGLSCRALQQRGKLSLTELRWWYGILRQIDVISVEVSSPSEIAAQSGRRLAIECRGDKRTIRTANKPTSDLRELGIFEQYLESFFQHNSVRVLAILADPCRWRIRLWVGDSIDAICQANFIQRGNSSGRKCNGEPHNSNRKPLHI